MGQCVGIIRGIYLAPRPFAALARPLARVPRRPPRAAPPLPAGAPRPAPPAIRDGAGVENLGVGFEDVGGFSTNDVSVVLLPLAWYPSKLRKTYKKVVSPSISP
jgi:hypothetical protein